MLTIRRHDNRRPRGPGCRPDPCLAVIAYAGRAGLPNGRCRQRRLRQHPDSHIVMVRIAQGQQPAQRVRPRPLVRLSYEPIDQLTIREPRMHDALRPSLFALENPLVIRLEMDHEPLVGLHCVVELERQKVLWISQFLHDKR